MSAEIGNPSAGITRTMVFATANAHKAGELRALLAGRLEVETLADHPSLVMPEETGETFEANAILKAEHISRALGVAAIADDSGLEVDALGGGPGVRSARYAPGTDADRVTKLLGAMPAGATRSARFVCAMALAIPGEATQVVRGTVAGRIGEERRGAHGFGYDPVFVVAPEELPDPLLAGRDPALAGHGVTMAELPGEAKNQISHRGRALRALWPAIASHFSLEVANQKP